MYSTELKINKRAPSLKDYVENDLGLMVGSNIERKCRKCKIFYMPTEQDISTKRPATYYKNCFSCRKKMLEYLKEYYDRKEKARLYYA